MLTSGPVADAFNSSETLVTEIVMDDTMPAKMQQLVMSKGVLPQGTTLRSLLDEEQKATFEEAMTKLGLPVAAFDQFEPWYAGMMLTMLPLMQQGYSPDSGVDKTLIGHAGDKAQEGLETIEGQIGMFDEMPQDSQIAFLVETAEGIDEIIRRAGNANEDVERLDILRELSEHPDLDDALRADVRRLVAEIDRWVNGASMTYFSRQLLKQHD